MQRLCLTMWRGESIFMFQGNIRTFAIAVDLVKIATNSTGIFTDELQNVKVESYPCTNVVDKLLSKAMEFS